MRGITLLNQPGTMEGVLFALWLTLSLVVCRVSTACELFIGLHRLHLQPIFIWDLGWSHFLSSQRARPHNWGLVLLCWSILEYRAHSYSTPGTMGAGKQLSVQVSIEDRATTLVTTISSALPDIRDAGLESISEALTATRPAETEADFYSRGVSLQSHCIFSRITSHVQNDDS